MNEKQYQSIKDSNDRDEWEYQKFCVGAMIALIGASWVLLNKAQNENINTKSLLWAIVISQIFLVLRGVRQFLNNLHNRKILEEEAAAELEKKPSPYPDNQCCRTIWGRASQWLFPLEPLSMILALGLFFKDATKILFYE